LEGNKEKKMTKENEKVRDSLRSAESIIVTALAHQPEGDEECREHLVKACEDVADVLQAGLGL
jgi:hypothetical protein